MPAVRHEFRFAFDLAFVRRAVRRDFTWKVVLVLGLMAVLGVGYQLWIGEFSAVFTAIVGGGLLAIGAKLVHLFRTSTRRIHEVWKRQSPAGRMTYRLDDEGFEVHTENGHVRYEWQGLRRLWRYPDVWALEVVKNFSVFFPPDAASEDAREFVVERCRAAGVRV